jgi:hypothetical protein
LKPERWGSLLVQENNQEEKACNKRRIITIIIIIIIISKPLRQYPSNKLGKHKIKEIQKTAIYGTANILRKILM